MKHKKCVVCNHTVAEVNNLKKLLIVTRNLNKDNTKDGYQFLGGYIHFNCIVLGNEEENEGPLPETNEEYEEARRQTEKWASELPIPPFPACTNEEEIRECALEHYNDHIGEWHAKQEARREAKQEREYFGGEGGEYGEEYEFSGMGRETQDEFLDRISVNFLRHELSPYDIYMQEARWRAAGGAEAQEIIRERILAAIAAAYPHLSDACKRQRGPWL